MKAADPADDLDVKALLARIERLEARAGGAPAAAPAPRALGPATAAGRTRVAGTAQVEDQPPRRRRPRCRAPPRAAPPTRRRPPTSRGGRAEDLGANVTAVAVVEPDAPTPAEPRSSSRSTRSLRCGRP